MAYLGIDTSNYTTSVAFYVPEENIIIHRKKLLPVKSGAKGLRQSDAVFHHTKAFHNLYKSLRCEYGSSIDAVCASVFPRYAENSYMPCFLVGENVGSCIADSLNVPFYSTSHQHGHILAALYGAGRLDLLKEKFIAFHISGGTTDAVIVEPDEEHVIKCTLVSSSLDLKAGQAVDRVGIMLGLDFPCGMSLDELSRKSNVEFKIRPAVINGNCSLSGLQNKCKKMIDDEALPEDVAKFCISYICSSLEKMTDVLLEKYGNLPLLYVGGVMSNSMIKEKFTKKYNAVFASPEFSSDNAAGVAVMAYLKDK